MGAVWRSGTTRTPWRSAGRGIELFVALAAAVALPRAVDAQEYGALTGVVLDETDLVPVRGADISISGFDLRAAASEDGHFLLADVPPGTLTVRVQAPGYATLVESLELAGGEATVIHFHMSRVTAVLDSLLVAAMGPDGRSRGHSEGAITPGEGELRTAAELFLTSVPGLSARRPDGSAGSGLSVLMRGVSSFVLSSQPHIYLDDVRIDAGGTDGAITVLDQIPASSVRRIRVLRGPASVSRYPQAAAGVILIETRDPGGGG